MGEKYLDDREINDTQYPLFKYDCRFSFTERGQYYDCSSIETMSADQLQLTR